MRKTIVACAFCLSACATSPDAYYASLPRCTKSHTDSDRAKECVATPEVVNYIDQIERQVLEAWRLPFRIPPDQRVTLVFHLGADGAIQCLSLMPDSEQTLARSVLDAVQRVAPFQPLPHEATCLSELPFTAAFSNPKK